MAFVQDALSAFEFAIIIPLSLFITLLIVRILSYIWYVSLNRRPLPVVIHDITPTINNDETAYASLIRDVRRSGDWQKLPSLLRDYISADPPLPRQLAPGVAGAASPAIPVAAAERSQTTWSAALVNLVLPRRQASYNIYLTPHRYRPGLCASVLIVRTPQEWIEASRTFRSATLEGLTLQIGSFCMECIRLQPPFLRRTPRWEHWGNLGSYGLFRSALAHQKNALTYQDKALVYRDQGRLEKAREKIKRADEKFAKAYKFFGEAGGLSPGNIRIGVHRASLHELQQQYGDATKLYDAMHCLWRQNIEVIYRAAAARVNHAHKLLAQSPKATRKPCIAEGEIPGELRSDGSLAPDVTHASKPEELKLMDEADHFFAVAQENLRFPNVLWRWTRTWLPRRRDIGERRYWLSWLRRDTYREPLMLLRRSKRYEYLSAVKVSIEADRLLRLLIEKQLDRPVTPFDIDESFLAILGLIRRKRVGWLAHWTAACYFSRAAQAAELKHPEEATWRKYEERSREQVSLGLSRNPEPRDWRQYCEDMAIQEIGRVIRNPCHQLNPELLHTDPDMKPLEAAFKASTVKVLIGRMAEDGLDADLAAAAKGAHFSRHR
jgi:hypothetical protein